MVACTISRAFRWFFEALIYLVFGELTYTMEYTQDEEGEPVIQVFCVTLILLCIAPLFADINILEPRDSIDDTYNPTELFARLLQADLIEKCTVSPVEPKQKQEMLFNLLENTLYKMTKNYRSISRQDDFVY